ncbi:hypothetical protein FAK_05490 [Desulfoferula mesophila]|uniref:Uncharacterized protein n=1 Tax=Desulfoferula mesophila TaxID=3058419 RepID=A0AAU9EUM4_9BACT|nr:hypothetical protein FAK_05490 [Desulfoferula mesophilus]
MALGLLAIFCLVAIGAAGTAFAGTSIKVVNNTTYSDINFGFASYKIVNGSSTRQGSGATTDIGASGVYTDFPPLGKGDHFYLDRGLRITSPDRYMTSDGSDTCNASGFSQGLSSVLGRNYMQAGDSITVTVTRKKGVIPGIYDAICAYSR